jgi:hypothetical protein
MQPPGREDGMEHFIKYTCGDAPRKSVEAYAPWSDVSRNTGKRYKPQGKTLQVSHNSILDSSVP